MLTCNKAGLIPFGAKLAAATFEAWLNFCFWVAECREREKGQLFLLMKDEITYEQMLTNEVSAGRLKGQAKPLHGERMERGVGG